MVQSVTFGALCVDPMVFFFCVCVVKWVVMVSCLAEANQNAIREVGGVDAIVKGMKAHPQHVELLIPACRVLNNLACNGNVL